MCIYLLKSEGLLTPTQSHFNSKSSKKLRPIQVIFKISNKLNPLPFPSPAGTGAVLTMPESDFWVFGGGQCPVGNPDGLLEYASPRMEAALGPHTGHIT